MGDRVHERHLRPGPSLDSLQARWPRGSCCQVNRRHSLQPGLCAACPAAGGGRSAALAACVRPGVGHLHLTLSLLGYQAVLRVGTSSAASTLAPPPAASASTAAAAAAGQLVCYHWRRSTYHPRPGPTACAGEQYTTCACTRQYDPVCGGGKTYNNPCLAACAGLRYVFAGACTPGGRCGWHLAGRCRSVPPLQWRRRAAGALTRQRRPPLLLQARPRR
jgi:hypothetical protein